ncbi:MAG: DEAD/DEAH box helicase [Acholeplasmataceae bacterium]|jgi:ATP-dependent RNA helicase DeaD|nr:DEAD/DEAH box helicase [Acholeplasmataceae bacterium]
MNLLFNELPILETTKQAIDALGLVETTAIQHQAIPKMLEGRDLIGQAQTGTGKTFAFAIPILEKLDLNDHHIQALVICPTRELTLQVYKEFIKLVKFNKAVRVTSIYGGESYNKQFKALSEKPHIVVATPGRAIDHQERGTIDFSHIKVLVMDEADEMLKMGFQDDLERLLKDTPQERQTALFSATIPAFIKKVAQKYQQQPEIIRIETPTLTVSKVEQIYYMVKKSDRDQLLIRILDYYQPNSAIIFANTKVDVDALSDYLQKRHYEADALHGDLKQSQRDYVMGRFRVKRLKYLIATDVAARGLDISHVDMVINYEIPYEDEIYVHRIGRTGRAGKSGISVSLVYPSMRGKLQMIERFIKTKMTELPIPSIEDIQEKVNVRNYQALKDLVDSNQNTHDFIINQLEEEGFSKDQIIAALIEKTIDQPKEYDPIEAPQSKRRESYQDDYRSSSRRKRDDHSERKTDSRRSTNYRLVKINLGKEDGLRPVQLLDIFRKHADMFPKNVGDIMMDKHETEFQIHPAALKRLEEINGKIINGKKIRISFGKNK